MSDKSELQIWRAEVRRVERAPRAEQREAAEEFADALRDPELIGERIGWLLMGDFGEGAFLEARGQLDSIRNPAALLLRMIAIAEWNATPRDATNAWKALTAGEKMALDRAIQHEMAYFRDRRARLNTGKEERFFDVDHALRWLGEELRRGRGQYGEVFIARGQEREFEPEAGVYRTPSGEIVRGFPAGHRARYELKQFATELESDKRVTPGDRADAWRVAADAFSEVGNTHQEDFANDRADYWRKRSGVFSRGVRERRGRRLPKRRSGR